MLLFCLGRVEPLLRSCSAVSGGEGEGPERTMPRALERLFLQAPSFFPCPIPGLPWKLRRGTIPCPSLGAWGTPVAFILLLKSNADPPRQTKAHTCVLTHLKCSLRELPELSPQPTPYGGMRASCFTATLLSQDPPNNLGVMRRGFFMCFSKLLFNFYVFLKVIPLSD